jgi:hypothetical protein
MTLSGYHLHRLETFQPNLTRSKKMTKNKKSILIGGLLVALVVTVLAGVGVSSVYAQGPSQVLAHGRGPGGGGGFSLTWLRVAAEELGMTTDELITALQSGQTLEQIAQEQGVDYADIQAAIQEQSQTELRDRIQQAVTDGTITQEKADWLLEGLDKGFIGNGPGGDGFFGGKHGFGLGPATTPQPTQTPSTGG